jgi:hypothetical protein
MLTGMKPRSCLLAKGEPMQNELRVYITIENPTTKKAVNFTGDLATLREILVNSLTLPADPERLTAPAPHVTPQAQA